MGQILDPCFGEGIRRCDEYLIHVLKRVFRPYVGRILAPLFGEGIHP